MMSDSQVMFYEFTVSTASHDGEKYELQRAPSGTSDWLTIAYINDPAFTDSGLDIHTEYSYRVRMWDDQEEAWSGWSEPMSGTTNYVYDVRYSLYEADDWTITDEGVEGFEYTVSGFDPDTRYDIQVRASDGTNTSEWSTAMDGTTLTDIADLSWVAPAAESTLSGLVDLTTETTDERIVKVVYKIGETVIGEAFPDE